MDGPRIDASLSKKPVSIRRITHIFVTSLPKWLTFLRSCRVAERPEICAGDMVAVTRQTKAPPVSQIEHLTAHATYGIMLQRTLYARFDGSLKIGGRHPCPHRLAKRETWPTKIAQTGEHR